MAIEAAVERFDRIKWVDGVVDLGRHPRLIVTTVAVTPTRRYRHATLIS